MCDWCIHGNIHSVHGQLSILRVLLSKYKSDRRVYHRCNWLLHPLSRLLQLQLCSKGVVMMNLGLNEVGSQEIINWLGRKLFLLEGTDQGCCAKAKNTRAIEKWSLLLINSCFELSMNVLKETSHKSKKLHISASIFVIFLLVYLTGLNKTAQFSCVVLMVK